MEFQSIAPLLRMAVMNGIKEAVIHQLGRGVSINACDEKGRTPLMLASSKGHEEICTLLLERGADPSVTDNDGNSALSIALMKGHQGVATIIKIKLGDLVSSSSSGEDEVRVGEPSAEYVACGMDFGDSADFADWEEDREPSLPLADQTCQQRAADLQKSISSHMPLNADDDWSDIEIELPQERQGSKNAILRDQENWLSEARELFAAGLSNSFVSDSQIDSVIPYIKQGRQEPEVWEAQEEQATPYETMDECLRSVLEDCGITVFPLPHLMPSDSLPDSVSLYDPQVDECIDILRKYISGDERPDVIYQRELSNKELLSRDREREISSALNACLLRCRDLIFSEPLSMFYVAKLFDKVKSGEIHVNEVLQREEDAEKEESETGDDDEKEESEIEENSEGLISCEHEANQAEQEAIAMFLGKERQCRQLCRQLREQWDEVTYKRVQEGFPATGAAHCKLRRRCASFINELGLAASHMENISAHIKKVDAAAFEIIGEIEDISCLTKWKIEDLFVMLPELQSSSRVVFKKAARKLKVSAHEARRLGKRLAILAEKKEELESLIAGDCGEFHCAAVQILQEENGVIAARNRLVEGNLRLAAWVARKYSGLPYMDLVQEGNLGLIKAAPRFDIEVGVKFSTYAMWWIRQTITRAIEDSGRVIRIPVHFLCLSRKVQKQLWEEVCLNGKIPSAVELAQVMSLPVAKIIKAIEIEEECLIPLTELTDALLLTIDRMEGKTKTVEEEVIHSELEQIVSSALLELEPKQAEIIRMRFGFNGYGEHTLEEIGEKWDVTRERIRQIEKKTLEKISKLKKWKSLREFVS